MWDANGKGGLVPRTRTVWLRFKGRKPERSPLLAMEVVAVVAVVVGPV
jgi:hypothetical protein